MKRQRQVTTRGCSTAADLPGLLLLAVARTLPSRRGCGPVSKGTACALGGTLTAGSDPREGVRSGQPQHHAQEWGRNYESDDVVGLIFRRLAEVEVKMYFRP